MLQMWRSLTLSWGGKPPGRGLDLGKPQRETIFNFAKHREPQAYRLIVERKGAEPPEADAT